METEQKQVAAPYLPFPTLLTALDHLANISIPNRIENSTFPAMSSQAKSQVMSAFRFLGLMNDEGVPTTLLSDLAHKKDERKEILRRIIEEKYPDIVGLDFAKLTPGQLENALSGNRYNVQGETRKKAKTFLLRAAQHAGFTVHPLLTKITRNRKKGATNKSGGFVINRSPLSEVNSGTTPPAEPAQHQAHKHGHTRTIQLRHGGSLTLSVAVDLWDLEGTDRDLVFEIMDKLKQYEAGTKETELAANSSTA